MSSISINRSISGTQVFTDGIVSSSTEIRKIHMDEVRAKIDRIVSDLDNHIGNYGANHKDVDEFNSGFMSSEMLSYLRTHKHQTSDIIGLQQLISNISNNVFSSRCTGDGGGGGGGTVIIPPDPPPTPTTPSTGTLTFGTPGTYTWDVPAGVTQARISMCGGGGAGGCSYIGDGKGGGGGGGAAAYVSQVVNGLPSGGTVSITVGSGGLSTLWRRDGSSPLNGTGYPGGTSSFGTFLSCRGGGGGIGHGPGGVAGGVGGTAGGPGGSYSNGGAGGGSLFGTGASATPRGSNGTNGGGHGAGGSGGCAGNDGGGGNGSGGIVKIEW